MKRLTTAFALVALAAAPLLAQGISPPPPKPAARGTASASPLSQNVRVDVHLTDAMSPNTAQKLVTMLVASGRFGRIRSQAGAYTLNVDASPGVRADGRIELQLAIEYLPPPGPDGNQRPANLNESLTLLVADSKPTLVSQSADPTSDRKVSVEVTATVVK